MKKNLLFENW